jgi:hypothetical protein
MLKVLHFLSNVLSQTLSLSLMGFHYSSTKHCSSFILATFVALFIPASSAVCQRVPSDFNRDGISELVFISTNRNLVWAPVDVTSGGILPQSSLGVVGDHVIMADWFGSGQPQLGVTRVERGSNFIVWRVKDESGLIKEFQFGEAGDTIVAAADFDASGVADAVLLRREGRKYRWIIHFDPFKGGVSTQEYAFGTSADDVFFIDPDGTGIRFAARAKKAGTQKVKLLNPVTGAATTLTNLAFEGKRRGKHQLVPLQSPNGRDVIAAIQTTAKQTVITVIDPSRRTRKASKAPVAVAVAARGDVVVGNFLSNPGFEFAIQNPSGVTIVNPFDGTMKDVVTPTGVLVDEFNINKIGNKAEPEESVPQQPVPVAPPSGTPKVDLPSSPAASLSEVCSSISAILPGEMLVKSEISKHIHSIDPRATGYTLVCGSQCPSGMDYVPFYFSDGQLAGAVGYFGIFSGNGKPRLYGAAADAPQHSARQIAQQAAQIGDGKLYLSMGNGTCKQFNPIGRNGSI